MCQSSAREIGYRLLLVSYCDLTDREFCFILLWQIVVNVVADHRTSMKNSKQQTGTKTCQILLVLRRHK